MIHLSNGNILFAWVSNNNTGVGSADSTDIIGQLYNSRGEQIGGEFRMNGFNADSEDEFDIAATSNGGFVMAYIDDDDDVADQQSVRIAEFDSGGGRTSDVQLAGDTGDAQFYENPEIAVSGNTVLVTYGSSGGANDDSVQSRTYNLSTNAVGAENIVFQSVGAGPDTVSDHSVATLSNGQFVVVVGDDESPDDLIRFQRFNSSGAEVGGLITGPGANDVKEDPHVVGLTGGSFIVVYETAGTAANDSDIIFQRYSNGGVQQGGLTGVATSSNEHVNPAVAALDDGGFVIIWNDSTADDILGRRYNSTGTAVGSQFTIDSNVGPLVSDLDVEGMDDGRFVVTWEENVFTGNIAGIIPTYDTDIRAAIYDPRDFANSPNDYDDDQVIGTIGSDTINVISTDDNIFGFSGNDTLVFNSIFDITTGDNFDGGSGSDALRFDAAGTYNLNNANLTSFNEIEFNGPGSGGLTVQIGADQVGAGLSSFSTITGNNGPIDTLRVVMETDTNVNLSNFNFVDWATGDVVIIEGDGSSETIVGTDVSDRINGGAGNDNLSGGTGNDTINGQNGIDTLNGGAGNDILRGGNQNDTINGDADNDSLNGGAGNDMLNGGSGNDSLVGSLGIDTMTGGTGDDRFFLQQFGDSASELFGQGDDEVRVFYNQSYTLGANIEDVRLFAQANVATGNSLNNLMAGNGGADTLSGANGDDLISGNGGGDVLNGQNNNDRLLGGSGADTLNGGSGNDRLEGGADNDVLNGNSGNDLLFGDEGRDTMTGGSGADRFVFDDGDFGGTTLTFADRITDFSKAQNDRIDLRPTDADTTLAGDQDFVFIGTQAFGFSGSTGEIRFEAAGGGRTLIEGDTNGDGITDFAIRLETSVVLDAGDFLL